MPQIVIYVAALNVSGKAAPFPAPPPFTLAGQPMINYLSGPAVDILLDFTRYNALPPIASFSISQSELNAALEMLLAPVPEAPVRPVGLILCSSLYDAYNPAEGFMFDISKANGSVPGPRQGCALFLDPIWGATGNNAAAQERIAFQAIHEIGHAFNLWHTQVPTFPPNFMTSPTPDNIEAARGFLAIQENYISHATDPVNSSFVMPGWSDFGARGTLAPSGGDMPYAVDAKASKLSLKIGLSHKNFYAFEPVELDIEIGIAARSKQNSVLIPEELDPGYSRLKIWIDLPNGERRLFRSSVQYCPSGDKIKLSKTRPFKRDFSIFWSSEGFTFGLPGKYSLQVSYELSPQHILRSNRLTFRVKEPAGGESSTFPMQSRPELIDFMRYKDSIPSQQLEVALLECAEKAPSVLTDAMIRYALGIGVAKKVAAGGTVPNAGRANAIAHLKRALAEGRLGDYRDGKARKAIRTLNRDANSRR